MDYLRIAIKPNAKYRDQKQTYFPTSANEYDVSDTQSKQICIDDICSVPSKWVKSIRLALRNRWTTTFLDFLLQVNILINQFQ